jgi:2-polyprenyl-3-methyl-5-hydroxy-6-metoxy-1,4-benzoquinol methylase
MKKCPFCEESILEFAHKDMSRCSECKIFVKSNPLPKPLLKEQLKDFLLTASFREDSFKSRMKDADYQVSHLNKVINPGKVYDVGAASGFFMDEASRRGWQVNGNDVSKAAVEYAKKRYNFDIDYEFFEDVGLEENSLDAVVMWNTLEHTHNPAETILHAQKALKPGGVMYIKVPEIATAALLRSYYEPYHFFEFNVKSLSNFLTQTGFEKLEIVKCWRRHSISATEYLYRNTVI